MRFRVRPFVLHRCCVALDPTLAAACSFDEEEEEEGPEANGDDAQDPSEMDGEEEEEDIGSPSAMTPTHAAKVEVSGHRRGGWHGG